MLFRSVENFRQEKKEIVSGAFIDKGIKRWRSARLSNEPSFIKIGKRYWKLGDEVYSIGDDAVEKAKMVETFGYAWETARAEGFAFGTGSLRKVCAALSN